LHLKVIEVFRQLVGFQSPAAFWEQTTIILQTDPLIIGQPEHYWIYGEGRSVTEFEKAAGWRPRYGIERLREALDDVAECRGLITRKLAP
jgi:hypothetical protein